MSKDNFIERNFNKIILVTMLLGVVFSVIFLIVDASRSIETQKQALYAKEQLFIEDTANITKLEDTDIYVSKEKISVTFNEKSCKLKLLYDKNWNLEEKEFTDTRISASFMSCAGFVLFVSVVCFGGLCFFSCMIGSPILDAYTKNKSNKNSKTEDIYNQT